MNTQNLDLAMRKSGINGIELAKKLEVTCQAVNNWRKGYNNPSFQNMEMIAEVLQVPVEYLDDCEKQNESVYYNESHMPDPTAAEVIEKNEISAGEIWEMMDGTYNLVVMCQSDKIYNVIRLVTQEYGREYEVMVNGVKYYTNPRLLSYCFRQRMKRYACSCDTETMNSIIKTMRDTLKLETVTVVRTDESELEKLRDLAAEKDADIHRLEQDVKDAWAENHRLEKQVELLKEKTRPDGRTALEAELYKELYHTLLSKLVKEACA